MQKFNKLRLLFMLFALFAFANANAQSTVSGVVTDAATGEPLPGVTVLEVGTSNATMTDVSGNYSLTISAETTLKFSFIGYTDQQVAAAPGTTVNAFLVVETTDLDEVVVVGYGTVKKSDKTGAVYSVSNEDIQTIAIQDPIEGIQGKIAGVTIRKGGSDPNAGFNVNIRGASGLSSGTSPLYVVDGIVGVDPTTIAPEDIESFNVLKDASSAAIYGSRGANGVIIITTKRGSAGKVKVDISSYVTLDQVSKRSLLDLMSADEYRAYGNELGIAVTDGGANTDWQDVIYRTGFSHNETMSLSGGNESSTYRASVSNNKMDGVVENSGKQRTIMRLNTQTKAFNDKLTVSMNLANTIEHNDYVNYGSSGADGTLFQAFQRNPTIPVYNEDGSYYQDPAPPVNNYSNPAAILNDIQNERDAKRLLAGIRADFEVVEGLKLSLNTAYTRDDQETFYFEPASNGPLNGSGRGRREYSNNASVLIEGFANYTKTFGQHNLNLMGGYSFQEFSWDGLSAYGEEPGSDYTQANDLGSMAKVKAGDINSWKGESRLISGFGRLTYNYGSKYFVTATLRRDGSSKFGANHEWGLFPSASLAWNIKNEAFLESVDLISQAKLRFGYGQTGNQEIDSYRNIALYGVTGYTLDPATNEYTVNYGAIQNPNPDLKWEVNTEINVGVDFGFLNDRISGSADYFSKVTSDLIYSYTVPVPPNLVDRTLANAGEFSITGLELVLTGHILNGSRHKWSSTFVFTHTKAIVEALGNEDFPAVEKVPEGYLTEPIGVGTYTQILQEGQERGTFWGPKFAGIDSKTGAFLYEAENGTFKTIDNLKDKDKQILGQALPDFEIGWSNSITLYKNININFTFRGMFGHDILNATHMVFDNPSYFPTRNVLTTAPNRTELTGSSDFSDYFLEKGDFIRLENFTVSYSLPVSKIDWLTKANIYISGNNLLTISGYEGIDPSTIGVDLFNVYPKSTSVTLGVNLSF